MLYIIELLKCICLIGLYGCGAVIVLAMLVGMILGLIKSVIRSQKMT